MERDSEYNRLNSSHNESEASELSFRRNAGHMDSSDSNSNIDHRMFPSNSTPLIAATHRNLSSQDVSPDKFHLMKKGHQRNLTELSDLHESVNFNVENENNQSPRTGNRSERALNALQHSPQSPTNLSNELDMMKKELFNKTPRIKLARDRNELGLEDSMEHVQSRQRTSSEPSIMQTGDDKSDSGEDDDAVQQDDSPRALSDSYEESK